jgi:tetratricopeptide (TPR) repeat protein
METFRTLSYHPGVGRCLHALGNLALAEENKPAVARKFYEDALALNQSLGLRGAVGYNHYQLAVLAHRQGLVNDASLGYRQALNDAKLATDRVLEGAALAQLSKMSLEQKDNVAARRYAEAALKLSGQVKDKLTRAVTLYNLAMVDAADGQLADAKGALAEAREAFLAFDGVEVPLVETATQALNKQGSTTSPGPTRILPGGPGALPGSPTTPPPRAPDRILSREPGFTSLPGRGRRGFTDAS